MDKKEIIEKLNELFQDVMDNEDIEITETTTMEDIDEWDSLSHVQLCIAIKREFGYKASALEMQQWKDVNAIINTLSNLS